VKKALFDLLGDRVLGSRVLDLFAGAGGVGIEALSRGAKEVWFVERDPRALKVLKENLALLEVEGKAVVRREDVLRFLRGRPRAFDIVFLDPPYEKDLLETVLVALDGWVTPEGVVASELPRKRPVPELVGPWKAAKERTYGDTKLVFWERKGGT